MPFADSQVIRGTIGSYLLAVLLGATILIGPGVDLSTAVFQAASAFGNVGLTMGPAPSFGDWTTYVILLPLALLGGLGIPVLLDLFTAIPARRRPHPHTVWAITLSAAVFLAGSALVFVIETVSETPFRQAVLLSAGESINSRSAGLPTGAVAQLTRGSQWIAMVLMAIGACPAGCGGGIKLTTIFVLARETRRLLAGGIIGRIFGAACAWFGIYLLIVLGAAILLAVTQPQLGGDRLLFLSISATSNVGSSPDPVSLTGSGLYILAAAMMLGRFIPLGVIWWTARHIESETDVAIG
jgi:trk system potassium uptake protein